VGSGSAAAIGADKEQRPAGQRLGRDWTRTGLGLDQDWAGTGPGLGWDWAGPELLKHRPLAFGLHVSTEVQNWS